jgi:hypothetical protein
MIIELEQVTVRFGRQTVCTGNCPHIHGNGIDRLQSAISICHLKIVGSQNWEMVNGNDKHPVTQ